MKYNDEMDKTQEEIHLKKKKRFVKQKISGKIFVIMGLSIILAIAAYTFILQSAYTKTALETEISRDRASADAVHKLVDGKIGGEDFSQIKDRSDEETQFYKDISCYLNEIRTLNSTRYIYIATRDEEGKLIYVVDGLDPDAGDVRHPGDYIEDEMIPYIERALSGENVYSQDIVDTTWGPIFTACYPVRSNLDGTGDIVGAFCMEMDMQSAYGMVVKTKKISAICGSIVGLVLMMICLSTYFIYQKSKEEERKQKQLLLEAAEKADAASQAKSTFLLNMSHDIRTPMNAIIGFTNIALHQNVVADIHGSLEKVRESSNHLLSLLNDVLDLSRIESGKAVFSPEPVDITGLTDNVLAIMKGLLYNRDLKFEVYRDRPKNPYVLADAARIREVLTNLLSNAVKFTKDGGMITLDISSHPGEDDKHMIVRYIVKDNGIGMSEGFQKKLFKPFSQEDDSGARTQYKGTGLGMAITKEYVHMMGGKIDVESKKGIGTTFTVEIPLELTEQDIHQKQEEPVYRDLTGVNVLMAEDNDLNAELATVMLEDAGMVVTRASDGKEAVERFKNHPRGTYDIILMDIRMPGIDGVECTRLVKEKYPNIYIIVLTTFDDDEYIFGALKYGASGYLLKGISMKNLAEAIRTVVSGRAMINPDITDKVVKLFNHMAQGSYSIQVDNALTEELTKTEWKVIQKIGCGMSNKEIASELALSEGTVRNYLSSVLSKLELRDRTQLAIWAVQTGAVNRYI